MSNMVLAIRVYADLCWEASYGVCGFFAVNAVGLISVLCCFIINADV